MSEFGLKIKNIEAATLYEYNLGLRDHYDYKEAMFTNSLFKDYMMEHGLSVWNDESTRDIICLEFNFGTRSYEEEINHLKNLANKSRIEYKISKSHNSKSQIEKSKNKRIKISKLYLEAIKNKDKYEKISKDKIRHRMYQNGVDVEYISYKKNGEILKRETIHYKMLYRSVGKAKKGSCMFIKDKLYDRARNFLYMGFKLPDENAKIVEISAYAPLISSTIIGKVKIEPENILVLEDVDRYFKTDVISVETDEHKHCITKELHDYMLKNTMFDGQALIDSSIFPDWAHGYILLRHHFCKMAAFNTNIQQFFKDYFKEKYETANVMDMFGNIHYVKDIKLITTNNAMKWLNFTDDYDYWSKWVYENDCMFGIVKTAHRSKLGLFQKMSYQMVNSLDENTMSGVVEESVNYIQLLKQDTDTFLDYLDKNKNFSNDYEVLIALVKNNKNFIRSAYFKERRKSIIMSYVLNMKSGKVIQNADNLVIVGSPYAMLLYATNGDERMVDYDDTFHVEEGCIQCFTKRFNHNDYLAAFRSPFNGKYNIDYLHNWHDKRLCEYFNFSPEIIAVNMNGTYFQDRNNGLTKWASVQKCA